jgi:Right handed beta helix region
MHRRDLLRLLLAAAVSSAFASTAAAQAARTWVSGVGDDANPCSRTAPCKTFAGAISKTAAGGEIDALDPGGFGAVTITKAITIDGRAALASILVSGTNGVVVSAGPTDVVIIRNVSINGVGTGLSGITFTSGGALHVEDCAIVGFTGDAIHFAPAAGGRLFLKGTLARVNSGANVLVASSAVASIESSQLNGASVGLDVSGTAKVTVHDSVIAGNTTAGVRAAGTSQVNLDHGLVANNGVGVQGDSLVRLSEVMVSDNTTGVTGNVVSFGNNRLAAGNGTDGSPATTVQQQ